MRRNSPCAGPFFRCHWTEWETAPAKGELFVREDCISDREGCLLMGSLDLFYCTVMITCW